MAGGIGIGIIFKIGTQQNLGIEQINIEKVNYKSFNYLSTRTKTKRLS